MITAPINRKNIEALIDRLERGEGPELDLNTWFRLPCRKDAVTMGDLASYRDGRLREPNWCGTEACVAGHAAIMALEDPNFQVIMGEPIYREAARYLGIDPDLAESTLFEASRRPVEHHRTVALERLRGILMLFQ